MTPQERKMVAALFERLAKLENAPRDPDAEDAIADGWELAPNAAYALVQTVLVQEEALKRANERILQLEAELGVRRDAPEQTSSFLAAGRERLGGAGEPRGSVPRVGRDDRPMGAPDLSQMPGTRSAAPQSQPSASSGSFLGTGAAAAAGVVGGSVLLQAIRGMFGDAGKAQAATFDPGLSGTEQQAGMGSIDDLARAAGMQDVGTGGTSGTAGEFGHFNGEGLDEDLDYGDDFGEFDPDPE